ncbi:curli assembly protein CsgC [Citrobacter cronae]|nr:curli assembly chaperone CsgC [Citrobacter cronae]MEB5753871.1 curli assembly protein CsgC [Citrobacter cronae]
MREILINESAWEDMTCLFAPSLAQPCVCEVQVLAVRKGEGGQSQSQQKTSLSVPANRPIELTKLSFNISPGDSVKIIVTVSDGQSLHLSQQWPDSTSQP